MILLRQTRSTSGTRSTVAPLPSLLPLKLSLIAALAQTTLLSAVEEDTTIKAAAAVVVP